ncbi:DUF427 domain-containing protein [Planotetraspora sp. A-T 1434]|uniref:DUF427 domain-containing protein n=1 Tax=Planotetraspora sp. A-T 1434 TaxID=2979219 RepID=UPI0021C0F92A|nr:DUF427 domain-containing protein [Planotetraspora sp. A-T 1434]MCT9930876.1 DUF427 domain-containing protein [Planotetraspora sp. A-T 1434]
MEPTKRGRVRVETTAKRVRAYVNGRPVADTIRALLVWELPYYPTYYFPADDVDMESLKASGRKEHSPSRGDGELHDVAGRPDAALVYGDDAPLEQIRGHVRLDWESMDNWFEEDEEVTVHPRDPYRRVDILASSRHVRVEVDGVTVADSRSPRILFETGLRPRYYLPKTDVRLDLLHRSDTVTHCPYKGQAEYWSVGEGEGGKDLVWSYPAPLPESQKIAGLVAFYNEKVDLYVDGVLQPR